MHKAGGGSLASDSLTTIILSQLSGPTMFLWGDLEASIRMTIHLHQQRTVATLSPQEAQDPEVQIPSKVFFDSVQPSKTMTSLCCSPGNSVQDPLRPCQAFGSSQACVREAPLGNPMVTSKSYPGAGLRRVGAAGLVGLDVKNEGGKAQSNAAGKQFKTRKAPFQCIHLKKGY